MGKKGREHGIQRTFQDSLYQLEGVSYDYPSLPNDLVQQQAANVGASQPSLRKARAVRIQQKATINWHSACMCPSVEHCILGYQENND